MGTTLQENAEIFAANRATGHVALEIAASHGRTRRKRVHEDGSLRVRFPNTAGETLEAVLVNTAGGMTGGDRFSIDISLGKGGRLTAGTAAAEKIYRSRGPDTEIIATLDVGPHARLAWLPQETILFDQSRLSRRIEVDLAPEATLTFCEAVIFGRSAMGESVHQGRLIDRWRVRRGGKLLFAETMRLDGAIEAKLAAAAAGNGAVALASLLMVPGDDGTAEAVRALAGQFAGEVGVSAWNGMALARFCAREAAALRHDLILTLAALDRCPLPRLWLS